MVWVNFDRIEEASDCTPVPKGKYLCRLVKIEEDVTKYGDPLWKLWFQIEDGEYENRYIFDNLVFSPKAEKRMKLICNRLGVPVIGERELEPSELLDKRCYITVDVEDYKDNEGKTRQRNCVLFAGYEPVIESGVSTEDDSEDDIPF